MPKNTKEKENRLPKEKEIRLPENKAVGTSGDWSKDQNEKSYYYDDSYGYEIYNPDEDEKEPNEGAEDD